MSEARKYEVVYANASFLKEGSGMHINWGIKNFGFGECYAFYDKERGILKWDTELLKPEVIQAIMAKLIEQSIFTDFTASEKKVEEISAAQAYALLYMKNGIKKESSLFLPFEEDTTKKEVQYRWHLAQNEVLNVWIKNSKDHSILDYNVQLSRTGFGAEFIRAEKWQWIDSPKQEKKTNTDNLNKEELIICEAMQSLRDMISDIQFENETDKQLELLNAAHELVLEIQKKVNILSGTNRMNYKEDIAMFSEELDELRSELN